jgi:hypothetical protein
MVDLVRLTHYARLLDNIFHEHGYEAPLNTAHNLLGKYSKAAGRG